LPWCPHTATGLHTYRHLPEGQRAARHWIVVATAHPAKFDTIVEPLLGETVPPPPDLARLLAWPAKYATIEPRLTEIVSRL
jgi:threonine synthase